MQNLPAEELPIRVEDDIVIVRRRVKVRASDIRLGLVDQTKIVTAASELARNTLIYGLGGTCCLEIVQLDADIGQGLRLTFEDKGPGIPDLKLALTDGYTSGTGMGLGLSGSKRLVNDFEISSAPGKGTIVVVTKWRGN